MFARWAYLPVVSVPLRGKGFESHESIDYSPSRTLLEVSVPLRGKGFERVVRDRRRR